MTAEEKFNARAKELGLDVLANGGYGHYGVETQEGVIVLVHEDDYDWYHELHYPSMKELSGDVDMRDKIFDAYDSIEDFDRETIGALYLWKVLGVYDDYPYPEEAGYAGVYFACEPTESIRFKDDKEAKKWDVCLNFYLSLNEEVEADTEEEAVKKAIEKAMPRIGQFSKEELQENYFTASAEDE